MSTSPRLPVGAFLEIIQADRDGDRRPSCKQLMKVAETGVQLFYAAIGHIDATEEFLEEARSEWGPLGGGGRDADIERRDPVTGEFTIDVWPPEAPEGTSGITWRCWPVSVVGAERSR
ncbi:hypothetical protein A9W99_02745 [Mycobacterium sp. 1164966.3]|uniref:hypothetical protein n=1 Tax=Mycobacterium sp. 1164966.3 TaxID=1856861 RepID=UPI0007FC3669|nr:hypothetical protein [Mycobacterium sp. 1164966.3]OBA81547.1 hypothetical protein A9W99_02745 [Mycobacterium sp. 1164966.3]